MRALFPSPDVEALELVARMRDANTRTPALVNEYYTRCIPIYQEFLGNHWHTGFYSFGDEPIGPQDQLRMERRIAQSARITADSHVLEVGCGIGGPACHLAAWTGAKYWGLTPNPKQIELARKLVIEVGVADRVTFDEGFADDLPYPNESFDVVLFFESPCHFPDRSRFFREVARVLRPGGRLAGEDWLACEDLPSTTIEEYILPICDTWATPTLGTLSEYVSGMTAAGLSVQEAMDLREEMALDRGFLVDEVDRNDAARERDATTDPIRRVILDGMLALGAAVLAQAFTIGRFLAVAQDAAANRDPETTVRTR